MADVLKRPMSRNAEVRRPLASPYAAPMGAHGGLSARSVEQAGFDAVHMGGSPSAQMSHPAVQRTPRSWAVVALPLLLTACQPAVLDPVGPVGQAQKTILLDSLLIMLAIVVPTILATLGFGWWFRAGNPRAKRLPNFAYSGSIEMVTWAIPLLTITLLGGVAWVGSHELDPAQPIASKGKPLEVQVVSLDWKWLFIYPDLGIASVNQLAIPVGTPAHFSLTSASVLNTFFVPQLGSMIYVMNGMADQLHLQADQPGTYRGISAHYSGDGFSDMHFEVQALPQAGFDAWVAAARKAGPVLDDASYNELAKQSSKVAPYTYRAADAGLFGRVVGQELAPGPGPAGQPGQVAQVVPAADAASRDRAAGASQPGSLSPPGAAGPPGHAMPTTREH